MAKLNNMEWTPISRLARARSNQIRALGVHLDSQLSMKHHVAKVAASGCHYHLRRLRQIRRCVGNEVTIRLIMALVILSRRPGSRQAVRGLDFQEICSSTCMRARAEPAG